MALNVINNPTTPTISGVINNPPTPTINGVVQASPGTISGVIPSPTGTNFNPQTGTAPIQPAATAQTLFPPQPTLQSGQTFSFMNGAGYDINGKQVNGPVPSAPAPSAPAAPAVQTSPPLSSPTLSPDLTPHTDTTTLENQNTTGYDIQKLLSDQFAKQDQLFSNLAQFSQVSPQEQQLQKTAASSAAQMQGLGYQAQGLYNPGNEPVDLPFLTGEAQNKMVTAGLQSQIANAQLAYMQGNRQFAFNSAKEIFDASRQNLASMVDIYTKAAPQNIATNYNPYTGDITGTMRNPFTGAQYSAVVGNAGVQKKYIDSGITSVAGIPTFYGVTPDGKKEFQSLLSSLGGLTGGGTTNLDSNGEVQGLGQASIPGYNTATNPQTGQPWRTDANNNPIAAAVTTGGTNQFTKALDQAGIKWTYGNQFPNDPNMSTIKVLGNPVEGARAILANSNALQGWYSGHTGAQVMNQYGISNNTDFQKAPIATQNAVIDGIYKKEAGSGILMHPQQQNISSPQQIVDQVSQTLPYLSGNIPKTYNGHYYVDTTKLGSEQVQAAQNLIPYYNQMAGMPNAVTVLDKDGVVDVRSFSNTMSKLDNLEQLVQNLPENALDPSRISNAIATKFGSDPQLALINSGWVAAIGALQAGGLMSSRIGSTMINNDVLKSFPTSTAIRSTALALIGNLKDQINSSENYLFGGPPPPDVNAYIQRINSPAQQQQDAYLNFAKNFLSPSLLTAK